MKKIQICILSIFVLISSVISAYAVPAAPVQFEVLTNDGPQIMHQYGDEQFNWTENKNGEVFIRNISNDWVKTSLKTDDVKYLRSLQKKRTFNTTNIGFWSPVDRSGVRKLLVVLISFNDRQSISSLSDWESKVFTSDLSAKSYYFDQSGGKIQIEPAVGSGCFAVNINMNHPNVRNTNIPNANVIHTLALNEVVKQGVNPTQFDTNGNGILEDTELSVIYVYAGYEAAGSTLQPAIWATARRGLNTLEPELFGNLHVTSAAIVGELFDNTTTGKLGTVVHELGHGLFDLPDLYTADTNTDPISYFSLMSSGAWGAGPGESIGTRPTGLDAWSLKINGWGELTDITSQDQNILSVNSSLNSYRLISSNHRNDEYFIVQYRSLLNKWDRGLTPLGNSTNSGLLILHIDESCGISNEPNRCNSAFNYNQNGLTIVQANTLNYNTFSKPVSSFSMNNLWYKNNSQKQGTGSFIPGNVIEPKFYDGTVLEFGISGISTAGETMTFIASSTEIDGPIVTPNVTVTLSPTSSGGSGGGGGCNIGGNTSLFVLILFVMYITFNKLFKTA